jgi:triosephosphate isomerase (TIM)
MDNEKIIIANWKMKLSLKETSKLASEFREKSKDSQAREITICPNFLSLPELSKVFKDSNLKLGSQDIFWEQKGAYTGEISPTMAKEVGCKYILIGHSERRKFLMENYEMIHVKTKAVLDVDGLIPVVCIGENWDERKTDRRDFVIFDQLQQALSGLNITEGQRIIVAYEPIWAIGSGTAIEPSEAEYAHKIIKLTLNDMFGTKVVSDNFKIIYGGSINSENAHEFVGLRNIDGVLVGVASLDAEEFFRVIEIINKQPEKK